MTEYDIIHANATAIIQQHLAPLQRGDFELLDIEKLPATYYLSAARRVGRGIKLTTESLIAARDILRDILTPIIHEAENALSWQIQIVTPATQRTLGDISYEDLASTPLVTSATLLAQCPPIGLCAVLVAEPSETALTLVAPLQPLHLEEKIHAILEALRDRCPAPSSTATTSSFDQTRSLASARLTLKCLQEIETICMQRANAILENVACVRALVSISSSSSRTDTFRGASALAAVHQGFPARTTKSEICIWFFESAESALDLERYNEVVGGVSVAVVFTKTSAEIRVRGQNPSVGTLTEDLLKSIIKLPCWSSMHHEIAHNKAISLTMMLVGYVGSIACAVLLEHQSIGVISPLLFTAAFLFYPAIVPRLFPYTHFSGAESDRRRRVVLWTAAVIVISFFFPILIELAVNG